MTQYISSAVKREG